MTATAATHLPAAVMDYDEVTDWAAEDVDALSLHPLAYAADANGSAVPIVSAEEFARWTAARHHNDLNGQWFGEVTVEGDRMLYAATEYVEEHGEPERFDLDHATGGFRIDGWTLIRLTDAMTARCSACYEAAHGYDPDMGDDGSTFAPGTCPACGLTATVFTPTF